MAETLGSLCDKLSIVKLKQYHCDSDIKAESLANQARQLQKEINEFVEAAIAGNIGPDRLTFNSNKIHALRDGEVKSMVLEGIGANIGNLANVNCSLWHEQEKVYAFEKIPAEEKNNVVKQLAVLNLQRNQLIDAIDNAFRQLITQR